MHPMFTAAKGARTDAQTARPWCDPPGTSLSPGARKPAICDSMAARGASSQGRSDRRGPCGCGRHEAPRTPSPDGWLSEVGEHGLEAPLYDQQPGVLGSEGSRGGQARPRGEERAVLRGPRKTRFARPPVWSRHGVRKADATPLCGWAMVCPSAHPLRDTGATSTPGCCD